MASSSKKIPRVVPRGSPAAFECALEWMWTSCWLFRFVWWTFDCFTIDSDLTVLRFSYVRRYSYFSAPRTMTFYGSRNGSIYWMMGNWLSNKMSKTSKASKAQVTESILITTAFVLRELKIEQSSRRVITNAEARSAALLLSQQFAKFTACFRLGAWRLL